MSSSDRGGDGLKQSQPPTTQTSRPLVDVEKGDAGARLTGGKGDALREKRKWGLKKQEEQEKAAYSTLMDLLGRVEERNGRGIYCVMFELSLICGLTAIMTCTLVLEGWKHHRFLGLRMWQYVMMAMILLAGLSIIRCVTYALSWAASCLWRLHRDLGYFLKEIKMTVDVTIWFCAVLFAWYVWFRPRLKHVYGDVSVIAATQITRFLIALCLGAVLWLGKNALFLWLVADLHYRQLCDRITRTSIQLHVLQILHNFGMWRFLTHVEDRLKIQDLIDQKFKPNKEADTVLPQEDTKDSTPKKGDSKEESEEQLWMKGYNISTELLLVKKETVPVLILQRLCKEYNNQIKLKPLPVSKEIIQNPEDLMEEASKLFLRMKIGNNKKQGDHPTTCNSTTDDDDEVKLKDLQEKYKDTVKPEEVELLFRSFRGKKCEYINESPQNDKGSGLAGFLSSAGRVCCLGKNESAGNDQQMDNPKEENDKDEWITIGRDEFCSWAVQAYRNCWGLESTLKSSEQIILKLNRMMVAFVLLLALIIWLLLSQIVDSAQIALLFSPLLAAKFIFSESTKNMFDGLIFALAMHPFNPGDRVIIEGMELLVTEINILSTTFYKYQTGEELLYPNSALATTQIINLELIPDQTDKLEFTIPIDTRLEDIRDLEIKIQMSLNERKDAFNSKVVKTGIGYDHIKMTAHFNYVGSYLTSELKAQHKSEMLSMIMRLVSKMNRKSAREKKLLDEKQSQMNPDPSNMEAAPPKTPPPLPSVGKPYIVTVNLHEKVKLKRVEDIIKPAIERSVDKHCEGREYKVVMNNVTDRTVSMAFYVWKKHSENHHDLPQELISKKVLEHLQTCILGQMENPNSENPSPPKVQQGYIDEGSSSSGGDGDKTASISGRDELSSSGDGHTSGSKPCSKPEVHIQPIPGVLDITWKKEKIDNEKHVEVIKNTIKRYFYKQYFEDDFEVKIDTEKKIVEIYAWRKFSHGIEKENQFPMEKILQKLDFQPILDKQLDPKGLPSVKIGDVISTLKAQIKEDA